MHTSSVNFNTGNATHAEAAGRKDEGNVGQMFTLKVGWCTRVASLVDTRIESNWFVASSLETIIS